MGSSASASVSASGASSGAYSSAGSSSSYGSATPTPTPTPTPTASPTTTPTPVPATKSINVVKATLKLPGVSATAFDKSTDSGKKLREAFKSTVAMGLFICGTSGNANCTSSDVVITSVSRRRADATVEFYVKTSSSTAAANSATANRQRCRQDCSGSRCHGGTCWSVHALVSIKNQKTLKPSCSCGTNIERCLDESGHSKWLLIDIMP